MKRSNYPHTDASHPETDYNHEVVCADPTAVTEFIMVAAQNGDKEAVQTAVSMAMLDAADAQTPADADPEVWPGEITVGFGLDQDE
jgi:hypothetical protein